MWKQRFMSWAVYMGSLWTGFRENKFIIDFYISSIPWRIGRVPLIILSYLLVFTHSVTKGHLLGNKPKAVPGSLGAKTCLLPVFKASKTCLKHLSFSWSQSLLWVFACLSLREPSIILKFCSVEARMMCLDVSLNLIKPKSHITRPPVGSRELCGHPVKWDRIDSVGASFLSQEDLQSLMVAVFSSENSA